ncbi:MAG: tetratricopeptide repeat protein [Gammaproteobacteria bacterium]
MNETTFELARRHFVDGVRHVEAGRLADAERCFEASLALLPARVSTLVNLGAVRCRQGRAADALPPLERAVAVAPDDADARAQLALALVQLGRDDDALACFEQVLGRSPGHPAALLQAALILNRRGHHAPALRHLERLVAAHPAHAEGWMLHGQTLQSLGRHDAALPSYERALALQPGLARAWTLRGGLLRDLGRREEAVAAFEQAIAHGGDPALNGFFLAALDGRAAPPGAPDSYVRQLFDGYAAQFDAHLTQVLRYDVPRRIAARLAARAAPAGRRLRHALDLGCGTGLCGAALRPLCERIDGVDLSRAMLERAAATGAYTQLDEADLVEHLRRSPHRHDLVVAADVFIYLGDLAAVFAGACRVLEAGGWFAFTVERADDGVDHALRDSLRYAHGERYLRALAQAHALAVVDVDAVVLREEQRTPIDGLLLLLQRR